MVGPRLEKVSHASQPPIRAVMIGTAQIRGMRRESPTAAVGTGANGPLSRGPSAGDFGAPPDSFAIPTRCPRNQTRQVYSESRDCPRAGEAAQPHRSHCNVADVTVLALPSDDRHGSGARAQEGNDE